MITKNYKQYQFIKNLGRGYQAIVNLHGDDDNHFVAIKNYKTSHGDIDFGAIKEIDILQKLSDCSHFNQLIDVDFIVTMDHVILRIITPLYQYDLNYFIQSKSLTLRLDYFNQITTQLLKALFVLHYRGIIHCDIKPTNILMDQHNNIYLADFGLSLQLPCDDHYRHYPLTRQGSYLYRAPEILTENDYYTDQIDLWSLGITLLEYLTQDLVTDPLTDFRHAYPDDEHIAVIFQICHMSNLLPHQETYDLIKHQQIHVHIDVHQLLNHIAISHEDELLLTSMLQINPQDRLQITSFQFNMCPYKIDILSKGDLHPKNDIDLYYEAIDYLIKSSDLLSLKVSTCLMAIHLFERYVVHYPIIDYQLSAATCLLLITKINELLNLDLNDLVYYFNLSQATALKLNQIVILKRFNYILTSCDDDELLNYINQLTLSKLNEFQFVSSLHAITLNQQNKLSMIEHKIIYPLLSKTYQQLHLNHIFSGSLFAFEMVDYIISF